MQQPNVKVLVISISNPILIGLYEENNLIKTISDSGKTSDVLPELFKEILNSYKVIDIFYVSGPGSYMAIKIAYVFLKTISIINKIDLYGISGFEFNNNSPIKALGKKYFIRRFENKNEKIEIDFIKNEKTDEFNLPQTINCIKYKENSLPEYNLPAV